MIVYNGRQLDLHALTRNAKQGIKIDVDLALLNPASGILSDELIVVKVGERFDILAGNLQGGLNAKTGVHYHNSVQHVRLLSKQLLKRIEDLSKPAPPVLHEPVASASPDWRDRPHDRQDRRPRQDYAPRPDNRPPSRW